MWTYQGKAMKAGRSWKDSSGRMYPAQWYARTTDAEKIAAGWVHVADPVQYDNRFYTGNGTAKDLDDVTETIDGVEYTTSGLKSQAIGQVKAQAAGLLAPTTGTLSVTLNPMLQSRVTLQPTGRLSGLLPEQSKRPSQARQTMMLSWLCTTPR